MPLDFPPGILPPGVLNLAWIQTPHERDGHSNWLQTFV